jgi:hypothetical protein
MALVRVAVTVRYRYSDGAGESRAASFRGAFYERSEAAVLRRLREVHRFAGRIEIVELRWRDPLRPDARRTRRSGTAEAAQIAFGASVLDCVLLDVSPVGARVRLPAHADVPGLVTLRLPSGESRSMRCRAGRMAATSDWRPSRRVPRRPERPPPAGAAPS